MSIWAHEHDPSHAIKIVYPNEIGLNNIVELHYSIDPVTQLAKFIVSLEALQDLVALAKTKGVNIDLIMLDR